MGVSTNPSLFLSPSISPSFPFPSLPPFLLKPGVLRESWGRGINPPEGVWETLWLPNDEKSLRIRLLVLTIHELDSQMDGQTDGHRATE